MGRKLRINRDEKNSRQRNIKKKPKHQDDPQHAISFLKSITKKETMSSHQKQRMMKRNVKTQLKEHAKSMKLKNTVEEKKVTNGKTAQSQSSSSEDDDKVVNDESSEENEEENDEMEDSDDSDDSNVLDEDDFLPPDDFDDDEDEPAVKKAKGKVKFEKMDISDDKEDSDDSEVEGAILNLPPGMGDSDSDEESHEISSSLPMKTPQAQLISLPTGELLRPPISMYMENQLGDEKTAASSIDEQIHALMKIFLRGDKSGNVKRSDARLQLIELLCMRYSYCDYLMKRFFDLFPKDILEFIEANETDRPLTIRTNTLKTRRKDLMQALTNRGMNLSLTGLAWSRVGVVVDATNVPHGATPEYLAGYYAVQGASSFLPVMALDPHPDERVLDLCAAPGMKTTYIGQLMKNAGVLVANDIHPDRCKAILGNIHRMGISNAIVTCLDGQKLFRSMHDFDRVLVDAPCSGTGIIAKDPSVKTSRGDPRDIQKTVDLQKRLLKTAIECCKVGGTVVYSTCSLLIEENEHVAHYALRKGLVDVEDLPPSIPGDEGFVNFKGLRFDPRIKKARRIYPHRHNMDGFFVIKFKKIAK